MSLKNYIFPINQLTYQLVNFPYICLQPNLLI